MLQDVSLIQTINTALNTASLMSAFYVIYIALKIRDKIYRRQTQLHDKLDYLIEITESFDQKEQRNGTDAGATTSTRPSGVEL